jgi:hypothetical protein
MGNFGEVWNSFGSGGTGGGGAGGGQNSAGTWVNAVAGTANTGGGGGGGGAWENNAVQNPANGGSGVVIVRYTRSQVGG